MKPQATWRCRLVDAWTQQESVQQMVDSIMLHPLQRFGFLNTFVLAPVIWNGSRNVFVFHWSMPGRIKNRSCGFNRSKSKLRDYDLISGFQFWESYQKDFSMVNLKLYSFKLMNSTNAEPFIKTSLTQKSFYHWSLMTYWTDPLKLRIRFNQAFFCRINGGMINLAIKHYLNHLALQTLKKKTRI